MELLNLKKSMKMLDSEKQLHNILLIFKIKLNKNVLEYKTEEDIIIMNQLLIKIF